jgi:hypothetical protein
MGQPGGFWAMVRTLSEKLGYTHRTKRGQPKGSGALKTHTVEVQAAALEALGLNPGLVLDNGEPTELGLLLVDYFQYRADVLKNHVQPNLMNKDQAAALFEQHQKRLQSELLIPMNKQKGEKQKPAYLTGLIAMLVEEAINGLPCNYNPLQLTTFTRDGVPLRTLARRVDGAFPSAVNPVAVWEVKEYYFTTTFGSRVADGVYETLLDGLELEELHKNTGVRAEHVLFVDSHYTWWICGKSYLCRMVDMLNMGLVSEVVFGREILQRVPVLAAAWAREYTERDLAIKAESPSAVPPV